MTICLASCAGPPNLYAHRSSPDFSQVGCLFSSDRLPRLSTVAIGMTTEIDGASQELYSYIGFYGSRKMAFFKHQPKNSLGSISNQIISKENTRLS